MGLRWLAIGDSITKGTGASVLSNAYIYQTRKMLMANNKPHSLKNAGIGGLRSDEILVRYKGFGGRCDGDLITIMCGTNDLTQSVTTTTYQTNLQNLINDVLSRKVVGKAKILLLTMPWRNDTLTAQVPTWNQIVSNVATANNIQLVDMYPAYNSAGSMFDTLHPNDVGHQAMANILYPVINSLAVWNQVPTR